MKTLIDPVTGKPKHKFAKAPRAGHRIMPERIEIATMLLKRALMHAKLCDCPKLSNKIRGAIKSAGGAQRHLVRRINYTDSNP